jgi:hypothetical protein
MFRVVLQIWFQNRRMKDKRQRVALAWPYGLAAESALYAYLVNAAAAAATSAHLSHHYPFSPASVHGLGAQHHPNVQTAATAAAAARHQTAASPVAAAAALQQHRSAIDSNPLHQRHHSHGIHPTTTPSATGTPGNSPGPNPLGFSPFVAAAAAAGYPVPHGHGPLNGLGAVQAALNRAYANCPTQPTPTPLTAQFPFPMRFGLPVTVPPSPALQAAIEPIATAPSSGDQAGIPNVGDSAASRIVRSPIAVYGGISAPDRSPSSQEPFSLPVSSSSSPTSTGASKRRAPCGLFQPYKTDNADSS